MSIHQNSAGTLTNNYLPAVLKENKSGWIIEYYIENPQTNTLARKQIRLKTLLKRYKSAKDARVHIARMIQNINTKLSGGWNPFFTSDNVRLYSTLKTAVDAFLSEKRKESRDNTIRSYESFCRMFLEFTDKNYPQILTSTFGRLSAVRYMEYIYTGRNVGSNTYNNQLKMARAFFNWMKEKCFVKENPFDSIKLKPRTEKTRIIIPPDVRQKIVVDLAVNNPELLIISKLVYNALIRPIELRFVKISYINIVDRYILIPASIAKNKKERKAAITQDIIDDLIQLKLDRYPMDYYLFSWDMKPNATHVNNGFYSKRWAKMRTRLELPNEMQLYSLRDSSIHEMLKSGIDTLSVMQHADHHSLEMTTVYGNHYDPRLNELINTKAPKF